METVDTGTMNLSAPAKVSYQLPTDGVEQRETEFSVVGDQSDRSVSGAQKLLVMRKNDLTGVPRYFLYGIRDHQIVERITARDASIMWDYLQANWPPGTQAQWIIL